MYICLFSNVEIGNLHFQMQMSFLFCFVVPKQLSKAKTNKAKTNFSSVQFNRSVVSDSLRTHESQHARPLCPSPSPRVHSDSRLSSPWCHPAISSSVIPFSSCPQSLPASESFPMSHLFAWSGQSTGNFSFSIIPSKEIPGLISFRMDWLDLLAVQGTLKSLLQHHSSKAFYSPTLISIHDHWKNHIICVVIYKINN